MNKILTITGPTASGKTTLEHMLCDDPASGFVRIISTTTRPPRAREVDGIDYNFVTPERFAELDASGELAESNYFGGNYYAALKKDIQGALDQGKTPVIVLDPNGLLQLKNSASHNGWSIFSVFLTNPAEVRTNRVLRRFIQDIEHLELGGSLFEARLSNFSKRLATMMTVESRWQEICPTDFVVHSFDEHNKLAVAQNIVAALYHSPSLDLAGLQSA